MTGRWGRATRRGAVAAVLATTAVLTGCTTSSNDTGGDTETATTTADSPAAATGKLLPADGAYLGLYHGSGSVDDADRRLGSTPAVHLTYFGWTDDWTAAPSTREDFATDRIPLVNWEPFDVDFADIVDGRYDAMVTARATAAAALPGEFFLDFAAEMNEEEGWGGHDPELYTAAWRHLHDLFTAAGADNAVWVWAPNNTDSDGEPPALDYYPGDAYVDWTGIDGYNWGTSQPGFTWQSFEQVFGPFYDQLVTLGKPVIIGETASDEVGGSKADWIADIVPQLSSRFPDIRAVVWFDVDKERHWQLTSSAGSLAAFRTLAADPYFQG